MKLNFVTFGTESPYASSLKRMKQQANEMGVFTNIWVWNEHDLDQSFRDQHIEFCKKTRGFGYWIWKPQVILQALRKTEPGDALVYADAGCFVHKEGVDRLMEYVDIAQQSTIGIFGFQLPYTEYEWTRVDTAMEVLRGCDISTIQHFLSQPQRVGGINVWIHRPSAIAFLEQWLHFCTKDNYHYVIDTFHTTYKNHPMFREHRHDQSIFSLLSKKYDVPVVPDETWFGPEWDSNKHFPIHARKSQE